MMHLRKKKSIVMVLSSTIMMIMLINLVSVSPTNALFVDAPEKPVLVYNTQIEGIKPGVLEVDKSSIKKTNSDGLEFVVLVGRTETNDKAITEDYKITVNNSNCRITKKNNISGNYNDNVTFTYAPNDDNMENNKVTVVCSSDAFNENKELRVNISLDEILNGIKFKPRELNFQYIDEEIVNLGYDKLISQMVNYLNEKGLNVTEQEVRDFAAYYNVTKMTEDFSTIEIPGVKINGSDGSFSFDEELKTKFEEYMGSKEYLDFTKDIEKYKNSYVETVDYLTKLPQNKDNPIYNTIMNEKVETRETAYYIYLESNDKLTVVELDVDNAVKIYDISNIKTGMELYLYIPVGNEDLDSKVYDILRNLFCVKKALITGEDDKHKIYSYKISEKSDACLYEENIKEKENEEIVISKDDLYKEAVSKLDKELYSNTVEFINKLDLNDTNPFYKNFDTTLTKKYVYYEVQVIDNSEALELEVLNENNKEIVIDYLTLIEVGNKEIKISKIEDLDSLVGLEKVFIYNNDELVINKIKELLKIDEEIIDVSTVLKKQLEILAEIEEIKKTGNELKVYRIKDNVSEIIFEEITKDNEVSYKKLALKSEEVKDDKTDYEKFVELLDSYVFTNTISYMKSFEENINPFYKDYKALEQINYIYYEVPVVNSEESVQSLDEVIIDYLTLIEVGNGEVKISKITNINAILKEGFKIYGEDSNLLKKMKEQLKLGEELKEVDAKYTDLLAEITRIGEDGNTYKVYSIIDSTSLVLEEKTTKLDETSLDTFQYRIFDLEEVKEEIPVDPPVQDEPLTEEVGGDLENKEEEIKQDEILEEEEKKVVEAENGINDDGKDEDSGVLGDDQEQDVGDNSSSMADDVPSETGDSASSTTSDTLDGLNNANLEGDNLSAQDYIPSGNSSNA